VVRMGTPQIQSLLKFEVSCASRVTGWPDDRHKMWHVRAYHMFTVVCHFQPDRWQGWVCEPLKCSKTSKIFGLLVA